MLWSSAVAVGIPDELFWRLTRGEVMAVLKEVAQRDRQANLRAGLIAATIVNVNRKKGTRMLKPEDFLKSPREYMSVEEGTQFMDRWARGINKAGVDEAPVK